MCAETQQELQKGNDAENGRDLEQARHIAGRDQVLGNGAGQDRREQAEQAGNGAETHGADDFAPAELPGAPQQVSGGNRPLRQALVEHAGWAAEPRCLGSAQPALLPVGGDQQHAPPPAEQGGGLAVGSFLQQDGADIVPPPAGLKHEVALAEPARPQDGVQRRRRVLARLGRYR